MLICGRHPKVFTKEGNSNSVDNFLNKSYCNYNAGGVQELHLEKHWFNIRKTLATYFLRIIILKTCICLLSLAS